MSGGSLDYFSYRVEEIAQTIRERADDPLHSVFADHLDKVAKALHDLEWVWSGDTSSGDEVEAIMDVLASSPNVKELIENDVKILIEGLTKTLDFLTKPA